MKVSTILDHIDNGHMALPEFQRGYVWTREQVRGLMQSLYRRYPVGSLLVWATASEGASHRGGESLAPGVVKLLLDGQQRVTSLYGVIRGRPPRFFDGNADAFSGLRFHLETEEFAFFQPVKMGDDPLWVDVSALMQKGPTGLGEFVARLGADPRCAPAIGKYFGRLSQVLGIRDVDLHIEEVTGVDKTVDVVVDIFNRVNSGGTKLSHGDLALAKICATWPEARQQMKEILASWERHEFQFDLDWLLRSVNAIVTGEAKFTKLHDVDAARVKDGLARTRKAIDHLLNLVSGRLGLDHDQVLFGRFAFPVMAHYVDRRGGSLRDGVEQDRLLYWYLQCALWGRYSASTESTIDRDLALIESQDGAIERLVQELQLWHGGLHVLPEHFGGWSLGNRFYPLLYTLTRVGQARDWGTGLPLKRGLLGKLSRLQVHHIFPKAILYETGHSRDEVNAVANFCFLTQDSNLEISAQPPERYFERVEGSHPGALASQWIPSDPALWRTDRYPDFLEARRALLAGAANRLLDELAHGIAPRPSEAPVALAAPTASALKVVRGDQDEEELLLEINSWVEERGLPRGLLYHELVEASSGRVLATLDLAWPQGLQPELSSPVALLLNESQQTLAQANVQGFRYFTAVKGFKAHVEHEVLAGQPSVAERGAEDSEATWTLMDRSYWDARSSPGVMEVADRVLSEFRTHDAALALRYRRRHIAIARPGQFAIVAALVPQKRQIRLRLWTARTSALDGALGDSGCDWNYKPGEGRYRITIGQKGWESAAPAVRLLAAAAYQGSTTPV